MSGEGNGGADARWAMRGYAPVGAFRGAAFCRFRLAHEREDGRVAVLTLGDYRERGNRLAPVAPGFNYVTWALAYRDAAEDGGALDVFELERAACNDWRTAENLHLSMLRNWTGREPDLRDRKPERGEDQ